MVFRQNQMKKNKLYTILAMTLGLVTVSATAAETFFMRVPAPAKCAGSSCVMRAQLPGAPTETPAPEPSIQGVLTAETSTDFGIVAVSADRPVLRFMFKNTGTEPITNSYAVLAGGGDQFVISGRPELHTCGRPTQFVTLQPGDTCFAAVVFRPWELGLLLGSISIMGAEKTEPFASISFQGVGGRARADLSENALAGLDFGSLPLGTTSARTFTLTNTGDVTLRMVSTYFETADGTIIPPEGFPGLHYKETHTCGSLLVPGEICTFTIQVTVTTPGSHSGGFGITTSTHRMVVPLTVVGL